MKKGFTLIELLAVIVVLAVIALIATPIILGIINSSKKSAFQDTAYGIIEAAKNEYVKTLYKNETPFDITYTYTNGIETSSIAGKSLSYSGAKPQNGFVSLNTEGKVSLKLHDGKYCVTKDFNDIEVTIEEKTLVQCMPPQLVDKSNANAPVLATGMTAVIWDETTSTWITASNIDDPYTQNWYDYQNKKWANAKTADGSMWVWIPRYSYQIASGYHTSTEATINIKFLKNNSNTATDDTTVEITPTYSDADTQSNYIVHPAFKFETTEITGFWVAKFEMSVSNTSDLCYTSSSIANCDKTTLIPKTIPNVNSWRNITIGSAFTVARNMETNSTYGWGTSGSGIDTHLIKNIEWGAVAYLSQSTYGKNSEIYKNNSSTFTTGCSGGILNAASYSGCQYTYDIVDTGTGASTTGTIYGIYDMSGGAWEYAMGNYDNTAGSSGLTPSSINNKYIDRYSTTGSGYAASNYGDAVYETSTSTTGSTSWYGDYSNLVTSVAPWFSRGGSYNNSGTNAGIFGFNNSAAGGSSSVSWRSTLVVGTGF